VAVVLFCASALVGCEKSPGAAAKCNCGGGEPPSSEPVDAIDFDALFVVNGGDSSISVIDTGSNEVRSTIRLINALFPHHLYLSADRSEMLLAVPGMDFSHGHGGGSHEMQGAVMLLDATTGESLESTWTTAMNHNALFSPDGSEVWTSQMDEPGRVLVLDATTLLARDGVDVGAHPAEVTFSVDGQHAFVANSASDSVTVIDARSKAVVSTIAVGDNPVGAWQGSNGIAYVDNEADGTLTAIDTTTLEITHTVDLGFTPGMAALGADGRVWVTDADAGRVVFYSPTGGEALGEVATGAGAHAISFHGDGTTAYVSNQEEGTVSVLDIETESVVATIPVGSKPNGLAWRAK
jgi:YVTN family beta-propeller protein